MTLLTVEHASARYPESTAGLDTSNANRNVGGIGGLFMYSVFAMKSTVPQLNSALSSWSLLYPSSSIVE